MAQISVVINTLNEAGILPRATASIKDFADEIVVCDMESEDDTREVAKKLGAKVFTHKRLSYVEPARNFAVSKATGEWILVLDVDEEVPVTLAKKIKQIIRDPKADYYRIPRKNITFGKWVKHSRWWPDYNIRLFRKGAVSWTEVIHGVPVTQGEGADISGREEFAIIHRNYQDIDEYLEKVLRYTKVQSELLLKNGYEFDWRDLVTKPVNEFLSRFFAGRGYKDGLHGLALSLLQAFSELVVYVRVWGLGGYKEKEISEEEFKKVIGKNVNDLKWWIRKEFSWLRKLKFR